VGHHYVPQHYLKGFEVPDQPGLVWMYDKAQRGFRKLPIKAVAQRPSFYSTDTESLLSDGVEGPAHAALDSLRRGYEPSLKDRAALALYVAVMIMRVPAKRQWAQELYPGVIDGVIDRVGSQVEEWAKNPAADQELVARRRAELESARERFMRDPPKAIIDQVNSPWPSQRIALGVYSMTWRVMPAPKDAPFLTSDNPVFFFRSFGLGRAESELTFALCSRLALFADRQGPKGATFMLAERRSLAREVNRRIASGADRFVFSCQNAEWIPRLAHRADPKLKRITWPQNP